MKKRFDFSRLFENSQFKVVVSVVVAVVAWLLVSMYVNTEDNRYIKDVPVNIAYSASSYEALDLSVVDAAEYTVTVKVSGPRSVINGLAPTDILVYPQMASVSDAGRYDLPLVAVKTDASKDYQIVGGSVSPKTVSVRFDHVINKKFVVEVDTTGATPAEGYILDKAFATPSEITLSGPESEVSAVSRVVAGVDLSGSELTESQLAKGVIALYDRDDNPLSQNLISFDSENIEVTVPILKKAQLPLTVSFTGVPEGLDASIFKYKLSVEQINVAGPGAKVDALNQFNIGYINISKDFRLDGVYEFDITLDKGFVNLDNISRVSVAFDTSALESKTITVSDIRVVNAPQNYEVTAETKKIHNVVIIGTRAEVEALSPNDVVAQIDASDLAADKGQQTVAVEIKIPGSQTLFAAGSYTALIGVSAR